MVWGQKGGGTVDEGFSGYDVIGDIHGHAELLEKLLKSMGYMQKDGVWLHPERQTVFLGDLIDRGPESVRTYRIVRAMVEAGSARCLMGNHEYNAVCFVTPDPERPGRFLRNNTSDKNRRQHGAFLAEVGNRSPLHAELISWFRTLPLWLELDDFCLVHACWSEQSMSVLRPFMTAEGVLPEFLYPATSRKGTAVSLAVVELCKGPERLIASPFLDKDGTLRKKARVCWWAEQPDDGRVWCIRGGRPVLTELLEPLNEAWPLRKPVIFGHYWLAPSLPAKPLTPLAACLDFSAGKGGPLGCYRFDRGDKFLTADKFFVVQP